MANKPLKTIKFPGLDDTYTIPQVDTTLAVSGAAADAKKTGDEINDLKQDLEGLDVYTLGLYPQMSVEDTAVASFTDGADDIPVKSLTVDIEPVQSGTGDPSPSNVRPISGWTGANVSVFDVNVWDEEWELGGIDGTTGQNITGDDGIRSKNYIPIISGASYYWGYFGNKEMSFYVCEYDANKNFIQRTQKQKNAVYSFDCAYVRFFVYATGGMTTYSNDISINYPSTDHDYHAYKGNVYSIDWTTEAGTVYGGTLDVTNGVLTVTNGYVDLGTLTWTMFATAGWFWADVTDSKNKQNHVKANAICSRYIILPVISTGSDPNVDNIDKSLAVGFNNLSRLYLHDSAYTDAATFKTAMSGVQLVYELATPVTYQLTPTEVTTLLAQNNIFANTGNVTLTYRADLKTYIDEKLA